MLLVDSAELDGVCSKQQHRTRFRDQNLAMRTQFDISEHLCFCFCKFDSRQRSREGWKGRRSSDWALVWCAWILIIKYCFPLGIWQDVDSDGQPWHRQFANPPTYCDMFVELKGSSGESLFDNSLVFLHATGAQTPTIHLNIHTPNSWKMKRDGYIVAYLCVLTLDLTGRSLDEGC